MEEVRGVVIYYTIDDKEQEGSNLLAPGMPFVLRCKRIRSSQLV